MFNQVKSPSQTTSPYINSLLLITLKNQTCHITNDCHLNKLKVHYDRIVTLYRYLDSVQTQ